LALAARGDEVKRNVLAMMAAALFMVPSGANAEGRVTFNIFGFDDMSCGAWAVSFPGSPARAQYLAWFRGFISGVNYSDSEDQITFEELPTNGELILYVDRHCQESPSNTMPGAAFAIVEQLRK
jgi:hypothetical protein